MVDVRPRKLSPDEVHDALKALRAGLSPKDIQASWNISPTTLHGLKHKYGDCPVQAIEQMERLTRENARLRQRVRYLQLDCTILQAGLEAQSLNSQDRRKLIASLKRRFNTSLARVCRLLGMSRTFYHYGALW